ncbi:hypothetical protein K388_02703 [Streptomyces sp. KhCrAH-43]|uniref:hypothetical protein n=1 Tax=unclassified Streptomyces TaxID=2593676 RepID=UPI000DC61289|nr:MULTISPECIES: hypothetical protein [unclassified Streptomyces]MYS36694.1 hypothetical protein [Streptomyces sp. SID4920]MYX69165.1 hypothetical protein [Streptomyces sp. SID8373]RAJ62017.1 hypothetical protein K388_02703 [Streptomyces sp. KhCrAH-43]
MAGSLTRAAQVVDHARNHAARHSAPSPEKPVPRTPPPISPRLKPRLATARFRHYLRTCVLTGPDRTSLLAATRPGGRPR